MDYSVKLAHLPAGFHVPQRMQDRLRFDAYRGELIYHGFMTKCTYDELSGLSDNADYHRALERLFVLTSAAAAPPSKSSLPAAAIAAAVGAVAVAAGTIWFTTRHTSAKTAAHDQTAVVAPASRP
jgi:hypothetical protein